MKQLLIRCVQPFLPGGEKQKLVAYVYALVTST